MILLRNHARRQRAQDAPRALSRRELALFRAFGCALWALAFVWFALCWRP